MLSVAVLISGGGSNLRALLEAASEPDFPAQVTVVGADRPCDGLAHAEEYGIPSFVVPYTRFATRADWGAELAAQLDIWHPDLIVLSGLMRLLPPEVVARYSPRIINTHPAYLPEFPGPHAVRDALAAGVAQTGASVIIVDNASVDLVPDPDDHGDRHSRHRPGDLFGVEGVEVESRPATPDHGHHVDVPARQPRQGIDDLSRRVLSLHAGVSGEHPKPEARTPELVDEVGMGGRSSARHQADKQRNGRQRVRLVPVQRAIRRQPSRPC